MRTPFAVGKLTRRSAEIVILEPARERAEPSTSRTLRALVRLARACPRVTSEAVH